MANDGQFGAKSVTVKIRAGTYPIWPLEWVPSEPLAPLYIYGTGQSEDQAVVLMNYNGEQAVLDGTCSTSFDLCNSPEDPGRIWTILSMHGDWVKVQGLTFQNADQAHPDRQ